MRYTHRIGFLIDTTLWERMDGTCRRLHASKAHFLRCCLMPTSVDEISDADVFGTERRVPHTDGPALNSRARRQMMLTLDDDAYELAWRMADRLGISLMQLLRTRIDGLLDELERLPTATLPNETTLVARGRTLLDTIRANRRDMHT